MSTPLSRAADRARIADIEAQILSLKDSILILEDEKFLTQERLNSYAYPVLGLPNEIISEIFISFLPVYPSPPPLTGSLSPTTLSHIRRKWREIASSTPALWRAIELPMDANEDAPEITQCWLSRSGCLPLSFGMESIWDVVCNEILAALVLHRARWEYVMLSVPDELDVLAIHGPMPLLRHFELRVDGHAPSSSPICFHEVPQLCSLTLWDFLCPADFLNWSQLTSLTLIFDPMESSVVLQHAVNLFHCHLVLPSGEVSGVPNISLPRLESLVLMSLSYSQPATHYLETLIAPALRTLQVPENFLLPQSSPHASRILCKVRVLFRRIMHHRRYSIRARVLIFWCISEHPRYLFQHGFDRLCCDSNRGHIPSISFDIDLTDFVVNPGQFISTVLENNCPDVAK